MADESPESMWTSFHAALIGGERWAEFDRVYGPVIRAWAARCGLQAADSDDLAQQVYLKLTTALRSYDRERGAFRGWLFRVVRNEVLSHLRHRGRHPGQYGTGDSDVREVLEQQAAEDLATELGGLAESRLKMLSELQARCAPQTWELVTAFHAGQPAAEVAARFGTTVGAVHQAVYRVRKLAQALGMTP